jgi:anti-sigma regulatory factor (Ser/Thr protein kinase)
MQSQEQLLFDERYPASPASVARARRSVAAAARRAGLPEDACFDLMLAVSEGVTNAVLHGFVGRDPGHVTVKAHRRDGDLLVSIEDDGVGLLPRTDSPGLGLGLPTIAAVTETMDVRETGDAGVLLSFALPFSPAASLN